MPETQSLKVELVRMYAEKESKIGTLKQDTHQFKIMVNGARVGYVCDHKGAPINFITKLPNELQALIVREVKSQLPTTGDQVATPPSNEAVQRYLDAQDRDEDEEDE